MPVPAIALALPAILRWATIVGASYGIPTAIHDFRKHQSVERLLTDLIGALPGGELIGAIAFVRDRIVDLSPEDLLGVSKWLNENLRPLDDVMNQIGTKAKSASTIRSPILLDLDGDGIETTPVTANTYFDHAADGFAERTGWASADDGLLVRDLNNNGLIDSGRELFGSETLLANGQKAANGFEALKQLDQNNDGQLNAQDAAYTTLQIWQDADGDGYSQAQELHTLADLGIQSIATAYTTGATTDPQGNQHQQLGSYTTAAGATRAATDVWFQADPTYSIATEWVDVPDDIAALPDATGYGKVRDLHQAMARDPGGALQQLVTQFTQTTNANQREDLLTSLIYHWTGVQNIDPVSRAARFIYGNVIGDARKLEVLEEFMGQEWVGVWCWGARDPNPHGRAAPVLLKAWDQLKELIGSQLMAQSHLKPLFDRITYTWDDAGQFPSNDSFWEKRA